MAERLNDGAGVERLASVLERIAQQQGTQGDAARAVQSALSQSIGSLGQSVTRLAASLDSTKQSAVNSPNNGRRMNQADAPSPIGNTPKEKADNLDNLLHSIENAGRPVADQLRPLSASLTVLNQLLTRMVQAVGQRLQSVAQSTQGTQPNRPPIPMTVDVLGALGGDFQAKNGYEDGKRNWDFDKDRKGKFGNFKPGEGKESIGDPYAKKRLKKVKKQMGKSLDAMSGTGMRGMTSSAQSGVQRVRKALKTSRDAGGGGLATANVFAAVTSSLTQFGKAVDQNTDTQLNAMRELSHASASMAMVMATLDTHKTFRDMRIGGRLAESAGNLADSKKQFRDGTEEIEVLMGNIWNWLSGTMESFLTGFLEPVNEIAKVINEWFGETRNQKELTMSEWVARVNAATERQKVKNADWFNRKPFPKD